MPICTFTLQLHCLDFDYLPVSDGLFPTNGHLRIYLASGIFVRLNLRFFHSQCVAVMQVNNLHMT